MKPLSHDERIDLDTLRFIRDRAIPNSVPSQRLTGLARRRLAMRDGGPWLLTMLGYRTLAQLAERERAGGTTP